MLTSPALFSMVSSSSASTRAISTRSTGGASRPGNTGALLNSRLDGASSPAPGSGWDSGTAGRAGVASGARAAAGRAATAATGGAAGGEVGGEAPTAGLAAAVAAGPAAATAG